MTEDKGERGESPVEAYSKRYSEKRPNWARVTVGPRAGDRLKPSSGVKCLIQSLGPLSTLPPRGDALLNEAEQKKGQTPMGYL